MLNTELRVFFGPASYSVPEGESQVVVLKADKQFETALTIDITFMDDTAVGKWMAHAAFPCTAHNTLQVEIPNFVCVLGSTNLPILLCICVGS